MTIDPAPIARSWLFAPGDSERKMAKAVAGDADAVILDLEDAVAPENRPTARRLVREALAPIGSTGGRLWVRINPLEGADALQDLAAVMPGRPAGIMAPKVRGREDVERLDHYLSALEVANGVEPGVTRVIALVTEVAEATFTTGSYRGAARLVALTWGAEDLADSIGASINRRPDGGYSFTYELARSLCLLGAAAAGLAAVETIYGDFRDEEGLRERAEQARRDGFRGMLAIHPAQVGIINTAFTPDADEIAAAAVVVAAFAAQPGVGTLALNGAMLDRPHLARAQLVLRRAGKT